EDAEAAADARGDREGSDPLLTGDAAQSASLRVGGEDEVPAVAVLAELADEAVAHDQELGDGLRRRAGLADHVEEGATEVEAVEQGRDGGGVHVVQDVQAGEVVAPLVVQLVP